MAKYQMRINTDAYKLSRCSKKNWEPGTKNDYMLAIKGIERTLCNLREVLWQLEMFGGNTFLSSEYDEKNPEGNYGLSDRYVRLLKKNEIHYHDRLCNLDRWQYLSGYGFIQGAFSAGTALEVLKKKDYVKVPLSGDLSDSESALAQCFMAIAGFVRKMSGTTELDTDSMNRAVSKMVDEALRYNQVESVLDAGEEEDIFSPEYFEKLSDVKMPATKLELLIKMIRKQIKEYSKINKIVAKTYQEMLEETIAIYHERRKHISAEEAGATQEQASEDIIKNATEQALQILRQMNESRESFRKIGLTFEEKAFYDILVSLRDQYNFEYGEDKEIGGMIVNDKCKILAKKVKEIIDTKSSFSDWLNNQNVRNQLKLDIKIFLVKNGYPPQYSPEVFTKVMEQVENFEENSDMPMATTYTFPQSRTVSMVAEDIIPYGNKSEN